MTMCFSSWNEEGSICGVGDKQCAICGSGGGGCLATMREEMRHICDTCRKKFVCFEPHIEHREKCGLYEPLPNSIEDLINAYPLCETCKKIWKCPEKSDNYKMKKTSCGYYEPLFKYKEENKMESWKERLKEEYAQLKERYEKLRAYNNKKEVEVNLIGDRIMRQEDYYSNRLLARQQEIMTDYLKVLELRAELAHIEL